MKHFEGKHVKYFIISHVPILIVLSILKVYIEMHQIFSLAVYMYFIQKGLGMA